MQAEVRTLNGHRVRDALAIHNEAVDICEEGWNNHTFDFETDLGHYIAPDITTIVGDSIGGRKLLADITDARAEYVCCTNATVTFDLETTYLAELGTTAVVMTQGDFSFTYPDQTRYTQRLLASSTLRILDGRWVFQHIHFGKGCS